MTLSKRSFKRRKDPVHGHGVGERENREGRGSDHLCPCLNCRNDSLGSQLQRESWNQSQNQPKTKHRKKKQQQLLEGHGWGGRGSFSVKTELKDPTPEHISRQNYNSKRYTHLYVHSTNYLQQPRHRSNLNVHQQMNGLRCGTYIQCNTTQPWKRQNHAIYANKDATRDSHTKSVGQIPYDITSMWNLKYGTDGEFPSWCSRNESN